MLADRAMSQAKTWSVKDRLESVICALRGVRWMLQTQHNAWIHAAATLTVGVAALALGIGATDWALIVIAVVAVWSAEALNTALECLGDATSPELNTLVGQAKDVAAGAVLISSSGAVLVGILVFAPYLSALGG